MNQAHQTVNPTLTKCLDYCYPTSPNAKRYGFAATGCWAVSSQLGNQPEKHLDAFATRTEAVQFMATLPGTLHRWSAPIELESRIPIAPIVDALTAQFSCREVGQ